MTVSPATREANLASARAAVKSDKLTVQSDEQAVQNTKLYAPEDGTIASLSGQVGEVVSPSGTTKASTSSSSSGSGTGAAATGGASTAARSAASSSSSTGASSSSGSSFAVLSDLSSMQLVVPLSESEIGNVKDGQTATVTVEALNGAKLAAHVRAVAILSTSSSGAVSYDVTFQLDQMEPGLKPGMSATAEVVVKQAEGVNVPTSAISAGSVTVERSRQAGAPARRHRTGRQHLDDRPQRPEGRRNGRPARDEQHELEHQPHLQARQPPRSVGAAAGGGGGGFAGGGATFFRGGG